MCTNPTPTRFGAVLAGRLPDRVPFVEFDVCARHVSRVLGRRCPRGTDGLSGEDYVEFVNRVGLDVVYCSYVWKVGRVYRRDSDGHSHYVDGSIKTAADLKAIELPDVAEPVARVRELSAAAARNGTAFVLGLSTPYKLAKSAVGYEDFLIKTREDPAFLLELQHILAGHARTVLAACLEYPIDAVLIPGDLCGKNGPLLSPAMIDKLWLPTTLAFIEPIRQKGIPIILHMDGDFSGILDRVLAVGPQALHPFEVCGDLDIYRMKKALGDRVTQIGNIDVAGVLSRGTPDQVRRAVRDHIERLAPGGRYACGSSHEISESVPFENFLALAEAIREFGKYPCAKK